MSVGWKYIFALVFLMFIGLNLHAQESKKQFNLDSTWMIDYDEMPKFPGGKDSINSFFKRNIKPPEDYLDIQGTIYISVVIDSTGKPSKFKVVRGLNKEFNNEALRILLIMPNWIPAKVDGIPINSKIVLPITFRRE